MAKVYAYATIAGVERDNDENSPTFGQDVRVDYEPGTDITNKFDRDTIKRFLEKGTAALYDRTKTVEEQAEAADEENALLRDQLAELELRLKGVDEIAARAQAHEVANARLAKDNEKLREELAELKKKAQAQDQRRADARAKEAEEEQKETPKSNEGTTQ